MQTVFKQQQHKKKGKASVNGHTIYVSETAPAHALGVFSFENFPCDVGSGIQQ